LYKLFLPARKPGNEAKMDPANSVHRAKSSGGRRNGNAAVAVALDPQVSKNCSIEICRTAPGSGAVPF